METRYNVYDTNDSNIITKLEEDLLGLLNEYKVNHWIIPALIDEETLQKCGYFTTMPNQLTAVGHFTAIACSAMNEDILKNKESKVFSKYYLTPAACIHIYPKLKDSNIHNEIITTYARVYRYEDGKYERGKRLWDFGVREYVAVGSKEYVRKFLEDFKDKILLYAQKYDVNAYIENASDLFFPSRENRIKQKMQKANALKKELVVNIDGKRLALASINYHGFHFSKAFGFDENEKIVTGCVGFGLDRWLSFINQFE